MTYLTRSRANPVTCIGEPITVYGINTKRRWSGTRTRFWDPATDWGGWGRPRTISLCWTASATLQAQEAVLATPPQKTPRSLPQVRKRRLNRPYGANTPSLHIAFSHKLVSTLRRVKCRTITVRFNYGLSCEVDFLVRHLFDFLHPARRASCSEQSHFSPLLGSMRVRE